MENKTAVEWVFERIHDLIHESHHQFLADLYESMIELEKEHIMLAYKQGQHDGSIIREKDAEQYYSQTYKSQQL